MIETDKSLLIVGEAGDGETALQLIETHGPDVAVLDVDMPRLNGFAVVSEVQRKKIEVEIVFLTMHSEDEIFQSAMDLGVKGYVLKDSATTDIVAGIKSVAAGRAFISPALSALLLNRRPYSVRQNRQIAAGNLIAIGMRGATATVRWTRASPTPTATAMTASKAAQATTRSTRATATTCCRAAAATTR